MCGLTGYATFSPLGSSERGIALLKPMADAIAHRGPDSDGYWCDAHAGVAFGHRRLAIVDLSDAGHQPMPSASGRYVIAFNGEIYNHASLRRELESARRAPPAWRGHSDTETLLAGFDAWGIVGTLERAVGMFAFAAWDTASRRLFLGRDRLGEKPMYYGWQGSGEHRAFLFGSELAALRAHPNFAGEIDRDALCTYVRHNCIGGRQSIYRGIAKLPPGCLLALSTREAEPIVEAYWSGAQAARRGLSQPFGGSPREAVDALETLLRDAIGQQMVADVPLGAFLSGGIDSSTVVALMQAQTSRPVRTFSIGFHEEGYDEARHAKAVAQHLGTDHTQLYVSPQQAMEVIPRLPSLYSEPFADSSQIPTFLVSQLARQHVTVSLSGDAGDELFCGYNRYLLTSRMWQRLQRLPRWLRQLVARGITAVPTTAWDWLGGALPHVRIGDKLHKGAGVMASRSVDALYRGMVSHWDPPSALVIGGEERTDAATPTADDFSGLGPVERMMALDMLGYLPDDILAKVDRAAMGVSLETRVPFLDHRVVEFAWSLPLAYKLRDGVTKWPLREVLYRHVPRALIERPKMGFGVPIGQWLRGPLREWAATLLDEQRLRREGYFEPRLVRHRWEEHVSGGRDWSYHLWDILMFQAWHEHAKGAA